MPYITQEQRNNIEPYLAPLLNLLKGINQYNDVIQSILCGYLKASNDWLLLNNEMEIHKKIPALLAKIKTKGQYNYVITRIMHNYIINRELKYEHLNDIVGIVENSKLIIKEEFREYRNPCFDMEGALGIIDSAKDEFKRTVVNPYEDEKIKLNGPVSELDKDRL